MTLLSEASFLVTPNGYKASKLYAAIPTNGNGDMTFTRATTATRVDENDLVSSVASNVPRIDYTGGGCPSILLEPQRTNLALYSEEFDNISWQKLGAVSVTANQITSPDGNLTADLITSTTTPGFGANIIYSSIACTLTSYVFSVYLRAGSTTNVTLYVNRSAGAERVSSNLTLTDTWQRYSILWTGTATASLFFHIAPGGVGIETGSIYAWGAQVEAGAYPTSYIPTTTATVTRNADAIIKTGISDLLNPSEGTFYAEISALANDLTSRNLSLSDGTGNSVVQIAFSGVSNQISLNMFGQGANYRSNVTVLDTTENHKVLIKWGPSGIFGFIDGDKYTFFLAAGTGSGIPTALNRINFSIWWGGGGFYGKCKGVQIYKTALSDPQCQALTTL